MRGVHFAFAALAAAIALAAVGCGGGGGSSSSTTESTTTESSTTTSATGTTQLVGTAGEDSNHDAFTITLTKDGSDVTSLPAGSYTLVVHDYSSIHNFHLTGPGVDVSTDVGETGDKTFDVTLQAGTYNYVCDPHASQMNGSFTVTG